MRTNMAISLCRISRFCSFQASVTFEPLHCCSIARTRSRPGHYGDVEADLLPFPPDRHISSIEDDPIAADRRHIAIVEIEKGAASIADRRAGIDDFPELKRLRGDAGEGG